MGSVDRLLKLRASAISAGGPQRRFAPDSPVNLWYLSRRGNNDSAFAYIRTYGLQLIHAPTSESCALSRCVNTHFLLATTWDPYSAITIGTMRRSCADGLLERFGIILYEHFSDEVGVLKRSAWYWPHVYVLAPESYVIRSMITCVPISVATGNDGAIETVVQGVEE